MGIKSNDHQMIIYDIRDIRYSVWYDVRIAKIVLLQWRPRLKVNWSSLKTFFSINWWFWSCICLCCKKILKIFLLLILKYIFTLCKAKIFWRSSYSKNVKDIFASQNIVLEVPPLKFCEWVIEKLTIN